MSRDRHAVLEVGGDASGDTSDVGPATMPLERPLRAGIDTDDLESHTGVMPQARTERHLSDTSEAMPLRFASSLGRHKGTLGDDHSGHAKFYESLGIGRDGQLTEASNSSDMLGEEAFLSPSIGARHAEGNGAMDCLSALNTADPLPSDEFYEWTNEKHEAATAASVHIVADEAKQGDATNFRGIEEDTTTETPPPPYNQPPAYSTTIAPAQTTKQAELASEVSASDGPSGTENPAAPRTPSPRRPSKAPSGSPARQRTRTRKAKSQPPDTKSPPTTRSAKKKKAAAEAAEAAEAASTQTGSPPRRKRPIKIILHFSRKSKANADAEVAPKPEAAGEGDPESTTASGEPSTRGGGCHDGAADEPDADADGEADGDEEVVLL